MEDHLALGSVPPEKLYQYVDLAALQEHGSICERVVVFLSNCGVQEMMTKSVKW